MLTNYNILLYNIINNDLFRVEINEVYFQSTINYVLNLIVLI